jgi:hypothetical protein
MTGIEEFEEYVAFIARGLSDPEQVKRWKAEAQCPEVWKFLESETFQSALRGVLDDAVKAGIIRRVDAE